MAEVFGAVGTGIAFLDLIPKRVKTSKRLKSDVEGADAEVVRRLIQLKHFELNCSKTFARNKILQNYKAVPLRRLRRMCERNDATKGNSEAIRSAACYRKEMESHVDDEAGVCLEERGCGWPVYGYILSTRGTFRGHNGVPTVSTLIGYFCRGRAANMRWFLLKQNRQTLLDKNRGLPATVTSVTDKRKQDASIYHLHYYLEH